MHIRHLAEHGVDVVPVVGPGAIVPSALAADGVTNAVFLPRMPEDVSDSRSRWLGFARDLVATRRALTHIAHGEEVDLVFASRSVGWISASVLARDLGLPLVWRGGSRITRPAERLALRLFTPRWAPDLFVANCEAVAADFAPYVGASTILPNAVDTARFDPRRVSRARTSPGLLVGLAARPAPGKGLELLVDVVARTTRELPAVRFAIAGDFPSRASYEQLFARAGVADRVTFLGHVADMPAFFADCDVVVLTSDEHSIEGSPNALLEAMAMERAIVATRVGGVPELIDDGAHALLVPPGDPAAFTHALVRALGDETLRRRLGTAARARVVERHGIAAVVGRLAALLRDVHARHHRVQPRPATGAPAPQVTYG